MTQSQTSSPARPGARTDDWLPVRLLKEQLSFVTLVWLGTTVLAFVGVGVIAYWREIEISAWDQVAQLAPWYALFIGVYVGSDVLALHLTHGQTRRDFMRQAAVFIVIFAAVIAAMVVVSFLAETLLYEVTGWTQDVMDDRLYDSARESHLVFMHWVLVTALWTAGGVFISSAWYRSGSLGALAIVAGLAIAAASGVTIEAPGSGPLPAFTDLDVADGTRLILAVAAHVALLAMVLALTWRVVRDVAVQPKSA